MGNTASQKIKKKDAQNTVRSQNMVRNQKVTDQNTASAQKTTRWVVMMTNSQKMKKKKILMIATLTDQILMKKISACSLLASLSWYPALFALSFLFGPSFLVSTSSSTVATARRVLQPF